MLDVFLGIPLDHPMFFQSKPPFIGTLPRLITGYIHLGYFKWDIAEILFGKDCYMAYTYVPLSIYLGKLPLGGWTPLHFNRDILYMPMMFGFPLWDG